MDDPPGTDSPQRARQCQYLYERVLHAVLRTALAEEAAAASEGQGEGAAELTAAQRHATVERALEDEDMQLGLITACVEVGAPLLQTPQLVASANASASATSCRSCQATLLPHPPDSCPPIAGGKLRVPAQR